MKICFDEIPEVVNEHFKGGDGTACIRMLTDGVNRIMRVRLPQGSSIGLHTHTGDCEAYTVLSGRASLIYDGQQMELLPGQAHYCPEGHSHAVRNDFPEDLVLFAVVAKQG